MTTAEDATTNGHSPGGLPRRLGLVSATALVIGEVIGVGIFLTPSNMAKSLASPFWVLVVWGAMGLVAVCGALCFSALAVRYPEDGGGYVYLRSAFGPRVAFLYGWMSLLVTDPGLTAMLADGLATYAAAFVPLSAIGMKLLGVAAILAVSAIHILGLGLGAGLLRGLSILKLGLLALIAIWGFGFGPGSWGNFRPLVDRPPGSEPLAAALGLGLISAFFSLAGFWDLNKVAGEVRDPERNVPRALMLGVALTTIAYILISAVFWYLVPLSQVDPKQGFAAQAGKILFGAAGARIFAGIVVLSVLGSLAGILMSAPRVYFAMARDGLFPSGLAAIHSKFGTPARATLAQAVVASILVATGSFNQIISYFMAITIAFLALMVIVLYVLPAAKPSGRVPGHPFTPLGFMIPVAIVVALTALRDPTRAGIGLGIVLLGLPAYEIFFKHAKPASAASRDPLSEPIPAAIPNPDEP